MLIAALDVDYRAASVVTAVVGFSEWTDAVAAREHVMRSAAPAAAYEPGRFFQRELPYLLAALGEFGPPSTIDLAIVDGYVWLGPAAPGLGKHLHDAIGIPVIGVAKRPYGGAEAIEIVRGESANPMFVTAVGIDPNDAAERVRTMHGPFRIPTLLKRADSLARG